jgi:hypothetical protein
MNFSGLNILLITSFICSLTGCSNKVDKNEYRNYIDDPANGLNKTVQMGDILFSLSYRPEVFQYMMTHQGNTPQDEEISTESLGYLYLKITYTGDSPEKMKIAKEFGNFLAFDLPRYMYVNDVQIVNFTPISPHGLGSIQEYLVPIELEELDDIQFTIKSNELFSKEISFIIDMEDVNGIPELEL